MTRSKLKNQSIDAVFQLLRDNGFQNSNLLFENLIKDPSIKAHYLKAEQASKRIHINKHNITHGIRTTYYAVNLFVNIYREPSMLRLGTDPETGAEYFGFEILKSSRTFGVSNLFSEDFTCSCIILSAFCHDMFKFLQKVHESIIVCAIENIANRILSPIIEENIAEMGLEMVMPHIESAVYRHPGRENALCAEDGVIMIADLLDNDEKRIRKTPIEQVIKYDNKPIEYFSCGAIKHPVEIEKSKTKTIDIIIKLKNNAGWHHVKETYETIKKSGLLNLISLIVYPPRSKKDYLTLL